MKKFIVILAVTAMTLLLAAPVLAVSLGISPSHMEIEVAGDSFAIVKFQVHYFSGDIEVSLVDIPLIVEPKTIHIEPSSEPVDIELTISGDESLGSNVYHGFIKFLGLTGGTVAVAVQVRAEITHVVEGQPPPEEPAQQEPRLLKTAIEKPPVSQGTGLTEEEAAAETSAVSQSTSLVLPVAGIAAGTAIIITLIVIRAKTHY